MLIISIFSAVLLVRGRENSHPGPIVWEETRIEGYGIGGGLYHLSEDVLYMRASEDELIAVDREEKEVTWNHDHYYIYQGSKVNETITAIYGSDDVVYIGNRVGWVSAIDAENGEEIWKERVHHGQVYDLHVSGDRVFTGGRATEGRNVMVLDAETGDDLLSHTSGRIRAHSVHYAEGVIYSTYTEGYVIAVDAETGDKIWDHSYHDHDAYTLTVEDDIVYSGGSDEVIAFDAEKEEKIWKHTHHTERGDAMEGFGINTITVEDDTVYTGCGYNEIIAAEKESGDDIWTFEHHSTVRDIQTDGDEMYIGGRGITVREKEGNLLLGMSRTLSSWTTSFINWPHWQWVLLGGLLIGSIAGIFLLPSKSE